jgi:hypothetical protein
MDYTDWHTDPLKTLVTEYVIRRTKDSQQGFLRLLGLLPSLHWNLNCPNTVVMTVPFILNVIVPIFTIFVSCLLAIMFQYTNL